MNNCQNCGSWDHTTHMCNRPIRGYTAPKFYDPTPEPAPVHLSPGDDELPSHQTAETTLRVVHLDGAVTEYPRVRYLIRRNTNYPDPIKRLDATTLSVEDDEQSIVIMNVRSYTMEF